MTLNPLLIPGFFLKPHTWATSATVLASNIMKKIKKICSSLSIFVTLMLLMPRLKFFSQNSGRVTRIPLLNPTLCKTLQRSDNVKLQNFDGQTDGRTDGWTDRRGRLHRTRFQLSESNKHDYCQKLNPLV